MKKPQDPPGQRNIAFRRLAGAAAPTGIGPAPHLCYDTARSREPKGPMTAPLATTDISATAGLVEKTPLERYVPPEKPSLVGLSRAELAEALASIGVPAAQRKMRVQQIWHWLYVRGAESF